MNAQPSRLQEVAVHVVDAKRPEITRIRIL
jgi:hypothetical protein